eukprot:scaffold5.g612.t1
MMALTFQGERCVAYERVPRPRLEQPGDCVGLDVGTVMGHELVGRVAEAGAEVRRFRPGDRVMCELGQLLGWVESGRGLHGAQAQFIRVPLADGTLVHVPDDVGDEEALLLGDILSTAFFCAESAGIPEAAAAAAAAAAAGGGGGGGGGGEGVAAAVAGCGPVGLLAVLAARELGATTVFAVDSVPERLALARQLGAVPINLEQSDPVRVVREATGGRGADAVLELVGAPPALRMAFALARPGAAVASNGCHTDPGEDGRRSTAVRAWRWMGDGRPAGCRDAALPFSPVEAYGKNVTYRTGRCPARHYMERLLPLVRARKHDLSAIVTRRLPLREGPEAYHLFADRRCLKVVLDPWADM